MIEISKQEAIKINADKNHFHDDDYMSKKYWCYDKCNNALFGFDDNELMNQFIDCNNYVDNVWERKR